MSGPAGEGFGECNPDSAKQGGFSYSRRVKRPAAESADSLPLRPANSSCGLRTLVHAKEPFKIEEA
jgi:hypothetical protein